MSLTLGLIVWFYEKQKTTRKPSGKRKKAEKKEHDHGKKRRKIGKQAVGKNRFHSILLCAIENLQIAFCFHCRPSWLKQARGRGGGGSYVGGSEPAAFELLARLSCVQFLFLFLLADWLGPLTK